MSSSSPIPPNNSNDASRSWWAALKNTLAYWLWHRWRADGDDSDGLRASVDRGHEAPTGTDVGGVVAFGVALLVLIGVCLAVLVGLYGWFTGAEEAASSRFADVQRVPPAPRLQHDPAIDLARLHRRTNERLHTYGWVDSTRRIVHIPIERAMRLVAERGLPYDTSAQADSVRRVMSESGLAWERRGPPPPSAPAYLGSSPEPFVPDENVFFELLLPSSRISDWEGRASKPQ